MKMDKTEFGNQTDFIGPCNYNIFCGNTNRRKLTIAFKITKYIYNSNDPIIISSNKVSKARNHMDLLNKSVKIHKQ